ncbi:tetratricopeptide repeat protein [bacterium]|nr:tetratricopeptide repeat protein [bacterium]
MNISKLSTPWILLPVLLLLIASVSGPARATEKELSLEKIGTGAYARKWAVVIGLHRFDESRLGSNLKLDQSALDLARLLVEKASFEKESVLELTDAAASRDAILQSLGDKWLGRVAGKDDLVFIFLSTLCFPAENGQVYLLTYDTDLDNFFSTSISVDDLVKRVKEKVGAKDVVLVAQTLFTGAPQMVSGARTRFGVYNVSVEAACLGDNFAFISSSKKNQPTWGTYFSDSLERALKAADEGKNLDDLFRFAHDGTVRSTVKDCRGCKIQTPVYYGSARTRKIDLLSKPRSKTEKPAVVSSFENVVGVCGQARSALTYGKSMQALSLLSSIRPSANLPLVDYLKGNVYARRQEWNKASDYFKAAVVGNPYDSIYCSQLANALTEDNEDGSIYFRKAYDLDHRNIDAVFGIAESAAADKSSKSVNLKLLLDLLVDYPRSAELHDRLSYAYRDQGKLDRAIEHAHEAVLLDQNSWTSFMNLGTLLLARGSNNEAQAAFRQVLDLGPDSPEGYFMLARALEKTEDQEGAVLALEKFLDVSGAGAGTDIEANDKRITQARLDLARLRSAVSRESEVK